MAASSSAEKKFASADTADAPSFLTDAVLDTLQVAFQPIVEASSGRLFAWESLMRMHERAGFPTPLHLLDHAHENGCLVALEKALVRKAVEKFTAQADRGGLMLFLNMDSRVARIGHIVIPRLLEHLHVTGLSPSFLCFELSERFDVTADQGFQSLVERMRRDGFRFAIDDFGAGVGEMKLLCDYPVDYVKIDRFFVSGIDRSPRRRHLVGALIAAAHRLGVKVIAEGVERDEESAVCRDLGADYLQGWFVGRPVIDVAQADRYFPHVGRSNLHLTPASLLDRDLILSRIEFPACLREDEPVERALEVFRSHPGQPFLPVLGQDGTPRGILKEERLKELIYHPFGRDLLKNRIYNRTVAHFIDRAPIVSLDTATEDMLGAFAGVEQSPCLLLTEKGFHAGVVSASNLLRVMHDKSLRAAQDQNPLTGLPGNRAISDYLARMVGETDAVRHFCYCDFDDFKPFNDLYGFQAGDRAITSFSALMRRYFPAETIFLGHVGGDDFFVGIKGSTRETALGLIAGMLEDFRKEVTGYYPESARAAGFVRGRDRTGAEKDYPLMRCSAAVLEMPVGKGPDAVTDLVGEIAALKSEAKKSRSGISFRAL